MNQRTFEWFETRRGKITASACHKIMGSRGLGKTGETYIYEIVASELGAIEPEMNTAAIRHGHETEPFAREYLSIALNKDVKEKGFIIADFDDNLGCSPDGIIENKIGVEIKCPYSPANHVKFMTVQNGEDLKKIEPKYYWQVMFSLYVTGFDKWLFVSFSPQFTGINRMHVVTINPNKADIKLISERVKTTLELKKEITQKLKI